MLAGYGSVKMRRRICRSSAAAAELEARGTGLRLEAEATIRTAHLDQHRITDANDMGMLRRQETLASQCNAGFDVGQYGRRAGSSGHGLRLEAEATVGRLD